MNLSRFSNLSMVGSSSVHLRALVSFTHSTHSISPTTVTRPYGAKRVLRSPSSSCITKSYHHQSRIFLNQSCVLSSSSQSPCTITTTTVRAQPLSSSASPDALPEPTVTAESYPKLDKLKELSYFVVQRSPTRHFSQRQFEAAQELCDEYYECEPADRFQYLCFLSDEFATSLDFASAAANSFLGTQSRQEPFDPALLVDRLRNQIRPRYLELFRHISRLDNGVKFLVDLRGDMLTVLGNAKLVSASQNPNSKVFLRLMSTELSDLLSLWFSAGFLRLERVTWDSPTSILQKISEYEAVHPIRNWVDLKNRVGLYRRCYMFSHSCLPGEPLVILHVALVPDISSSIQEIIIKTTHQASFRRSPSSAPPSAQQDVLGSTTLESAKAAAYKMFNPSSFARFTHAAFEDPKRIDAAIFYSISSTQKGLNGIDLGHHMIQQVASELKVEFAQMRQYSSLSPIPNFTEYLLSTIQAIQRNDESKNFTSFWHKYGDFPQLQSYVMGNGRFASPKESGLDQSGALFWSRLVHLLRSGEWYNDPLLVELLEAPLMHICAHYLYNEKRRGYALNSVANFHLKNGAVMWRLNWLADTSSRGMANSCGMMINYRYYLEKQTDNSQTYLNEKRIVAGDKFVKWLQ